MSELDAHQITIESLDMAAKLAEFVSKVSGGKVGLGATTVAAFMRTASAAMSARGESADSILHRIRNPPNLKSWEAIIAEADAEPITKSEKLKSEPPK